MRHWRNLCAVVPYFQEDRGLLSRALRSIDMQGLRPDAVFVIDDGSPTPAEHDIRAAACAARVRLVRQSNAGPAAARNAGLDMAQRDGYRFVAFLDSDDAWKPDHLERASRCLGLGHDVFVSNWHPAAFPGSDAYAQWAKLDVADHRSLGDALYSFVGDPFGHEINAVLSRPSTLVYDRSRFPGVRFDPRLWIAEDKLFYLTLLAHGARCAFSARPTVRAGIGVSIFESSKYGTHDALRRCIHQARSHRLAQRLPGAGKYARALRDLRRRIVADFLGSFLSLAAHRRELDLQAFATMAREEPALLALALVASPVKAAKAQLAPMFF